MTDTTTILALKPYLEAIEQCCRKLTYEDLCEVIEHLAREVAPRERAGFLAKLELHVEPSDEVPEDTDFEDELIERIRELKAEISDRQTAIEDGSYYEEYGYYDEYYDEEIEALSEEQRDELQTLFVETNHLFLTDELELAEHAYRLLLNMFGAVGPEEEEEEEFYYSMSEYDVKINWRETRARYCRCVYEVCPPEEQMDRMLAAMQIHVNQFESRYAPSEGNYPQLQDVFDAKTGELPDWENFLKQWQQALAGQTQNRAFVLSLEAVSWLEGVTGVARDVRKRRIPVGYLFWLDQLTSKHLWQEAGEIAQEALDNMSEGPLRAQAADMMYSVGTETGNRGLMLQGRREGFYSTPNMSSLAVFLEEAIRQDVRNDELENALNFLNTKEHVVSLKVHVLLMLGRLDEASNQVDTDKSLGWSYGASSVGVFFGGLLTALTHADEQGVTIQTLLKRYAGTGSSYSFYTFQTQQPGSGDLILNEIRQGLRDVPMDVTKQQEWLALAGKLGGDRIDGIVSNQHRKAYDRAAEVLGALMECHLLNNRSTEARALLGTYRDVKYKRHSAFRAELNTVMRSSALLCSYVSKK